MTNEILLCTALVMAGESAKNDVDDKVWYNDGNERHEAREASAGDRRAIADADQAGQLDISGEAKIERLFRTPEPSTNAARMAHNATHVPLYQTDYMFIPTVAASKTQPCIITFVETRSGVVISFMCVRQG